MSANEAIAQGPFRRLMFYQLQDLSPSDSCISSSEASPQRSRFVCEAFSCRACNSVQPRPDKGGLNPCPQCPIIFKSIFLNTRQESLSGLRTGEDTPRGMNANTPDRASGIAISAREWLCNLYVLFALFGDSTCFTYVKAKCPMSCPYLCEGFPFKSTNKRRAPLLRT